MKKIRLHLGCGNDKRKGYLNCDLSPEVAPDLVLDLEKTPLQFKDDSADEILANHVLEHVTNFVPLMHELWRVCKKGALITIRVPFYAAWGQFNDPTHIRFFTPFTFNYFKKGNYSHEVGANKDMFHVEKVTINYGIGRMKKFNWLINPLINWNQELYCRLFAFILPASEIHYRLRVIKLRYPKDSSQSKINKP